VLCQFTGEPGQRTLAEFIRVPGVYAAGRLDADSEGLLLLTDDGALQHKITEPRFGHPRTYWVQVEGAIGEGALHQLASGLSIGDYKTLPCRARPIEEPALPARVPPVRFRKNIPTSWIELTLQEGRNRQVRRMTAAVGFPTLRLVRCGIGTLTLNELAPGQWRDLTAAEVGELKKRRP
jgi:23S rRNA pseudouridine2457 synthase